MLWDDFNTSSNGGIVTNSSGGAVPLIHQGNLASYSTWRYDCAGSACSSHSYVFNATSPKPGSALHARTTFDTSNSYNQSLNLTYSQFTTGNALYFSYYYRPTITGGQWPRQSKLLQSFIPGYSEDRFYVSAAYGTSCEGSTTYRQHITSPTDEFQFSATGQSFNGLWTRVDNFLIQSGASQANGRWDTSLYKANGTFETHSFTNKTLRSSSAETTIYEMGGAYWDFCNTSPGTVDVDDVYVDSTPQRVEVCSGSTWAARNKCELQLPTSWADGSVTITAKTAQFTTGQTAYAYILDATNAPNANGFAITIDSGSTTNPPVMQSVSCTPTLNQAPAATACTASATNSPTSYTWTGQGTNCTFSAPTAASTNLTCSFGGARTPCATATNAGGTSAQLCVSANSVVWRYVKPTGFGAN
jgi:hypothetical protein